MPWTKIRGHENYSINEAGSVRNDITGKIKSTYINKKNGYRYVDLYKNNICSSRSVHRLLAETFIPNPEGKPTVDHANSDRLDNSLNNLRWATYSEQNSRFKTIGIRSEKIRVTNEDGSFIDFERIVDAARYFECTASNISQMLKKGTFGKRGKTRYYKFEYLKKNVNA